MTKARPTSLPVGRAFLQMRYRNGDCLFYPDASAKIRTTDGYLTAFPRYCWL